VIRRRVKIGYAACVFTPKEREFFIDNLLVKIHLIIEMILVDRPCAITQTLVSLSLKIQDPLGPVTRVKKKKKHSLEPPPVFG